MKTFKIKDKSNNNDLFICYQDDKTSSVIIKNNSIVMKSDSHFILKKKIKTNNYFIETFFLLNILKAKKNILMSFVKNKNFEIKFYPKYKEKTYKQSISLFPPLKNNDIEGYFLTIFFNNEPKYFVEQLIGNET